MSDTLALSLGCLALAAGGFLLFKIADPAHRFLKRVPDHWEREGVIRNGWSKVWQEDSPERFSFRVRSFRAGAVFVWLWFKAVGVILLFTSVITFVGQFWN